MSTRPKRFSLFLFHFVPFCSISSFCEDLAVGDRLYLVWYMCSCLSNRRSEGILHRGRGGLTGVLDSRFHMPRIIERAVCNCEGSKESRVAWFRDRGPFQLRDFAWRTRILDSSLRCAAFGMTGVGGRYVWNNSCRLSTGTAWNENMRRAETGDHKGCPYGRLVGGYFRSNRSCRFSPTPIRMKMGAERRTGNHKGCPYEWLAGGYFQRNDSERTIRAYLTDSEQLLGRESA